MGTARCSGARQAEHGEARGLPVRSRKGCGRFRKRVARFPEPPDGSGKRAARFGKGDVAFCKPRVRFMKRAARLARRTARFRKPTGDAR